MTFPLLELTVGDVTHGACVARHDGRVVFVRHALPGERVRARVTEQRSRFWRADAVEVLDASPDRVPAPCGYAGPAGCGGCDWQHADPAAARRIKGQVLAAEFRRHKLGGPGEPTALTELPGGALGWRTRVDFAVNGAGRAGLHAHRSHRIVALRDCPLVHPDAAVSGVLARRWPGAARVRVACSGTGERAILPSPLPGAHVAGRSGPRLLREPVTGGTLEVPAAGFWQGHPAAARELAQRVLAAATVNPGELAWDLYAGAGLFSHALARAGARVVAVESDRRAARAAEGNLADFEVEVVTAPVEDWLAGEPVVVPDVVVLDPPRSGPAPGVAQRLAQLPARCLIYVACDAATLARDVAVLTAGGWRWESLEGIDAFPMTAHLESVTVLRR